MPMKSELTNELKEFIKSHGAKVVGIGDLRMYEFDENSGDKKKFFEKFKFGISIGLRLDDEIIDQIGNKPTVAYADHYRNINRNLDEIAVKVRNWIENKQFDAYIIPASKIVDEIELKGEISHKAVARIAGIGWQGKSLLIINPEFGPRFRMVTILTNMALKADKPIKNRCGVCEICKLLCPAFAIKGVKPLNGDYYKSRDEAIDLEKCYKKLCEFREMDGINATVCGVCVKVCPWGDKKNGKKRLSKINRF